MGVDFSFCKAGWSYGGFDRFRERLLESVSDYDVDPIMPLLNLRDTPTPVLYNGVWQDVFDFLSPSDCAKIIPRLREIIKDWDDSDEDASYDKQQALHLIEGMQYSVKNLKNLFIG